jgi:hypothetical protein
VAGQANSRSTPGRLMCSKNAPESPPDYLCSCSIAKSSSNRARVTWVYARAWPLLMTTFQCACRYQLATRGLGAGLPSWVGGRRLWYTPLWSSRVAKEKRFG